MEVEIKVDGRQIFHSDVLTSEGRKLLKLVDEINNRKRELHAKYGPPCIVRKHRSYSRDSPSMRIVPYARPGGIH